MFDQYSNIIEKMNVGGRAKTPFLFGLNFEQSEGFFVSNPEEQKDILFQINGFTNYHSTPPSLPHIGLEYHPESIDEYKKKFDNVMYNITIGKIEMINLTLKTPISSSLSLLDIFEHSKAKYRVYVPGHFVCFSPEIFVQTKNDKIYSYPMKGTINANIPNAETIIIDSKKEIEEHKIAVEIIHDDLRKVATNVATRRFRYIDIIENHKGKLLQVSSEVTGTLPHNFTDNIGTLIHQLLPAGSIAGYPRDNARQIINQVENRTRGYYTGIVGYFDGKNLDSGVLIRYIEQEGNSLFFRSGGGITINSNLEKEYQEVLEKIYLPF